MKRKASISHDETIIRRLRRDPDFAAEYLKAALEDEDEPRVPVRDPELQRSSSFPEVLMERRYSTSHRNITPDNRPSSTRE